jgi:uncharacterized membrane protein YgdD (TMEM256/DUF423 family)
VNLLRGVDKQHGKQMKEGGKDINRFWLAAGAINGLIAVAMGAFAAHGLKDRLAPEALDWVRTASIYEMWHALALIVVAALLPRSPAVKIAGWGFLAGCVLFSGSLYLLALTGWHCFAFVTPLGGIAFLIGWAALAWYAIAGSRKT